MLLGYMNWWDSLRSQVHVLFLLLLLDMLR
jgi:hypothetical protein